MAVVGVGLLIGEHDVSTSRLVNVAPDVADPASPVPALAVFAWDRLLRGSVAHGLAADIRPESSVGRSAGEIGYVVSVSAARWRALVCTNPFVAWPCDWALATISCESSSDPNAWATELVDTDGDGIRERWYFHGLWQIASRLPDAGPLANPYLNTVEANLKYANGGTAHWPGCP